MTDWIIFFLLSKLAIGLFDEYIQHELTYTHALTNKKRIIHFPIFLSELCLKLHYWLNLCERKMIYVLQNICRWYLFYNTLSVPVCIISISWNTLFPLPYCINLSILWYISCYSIGSYFYEKLRWKNRQIFFCFEQNVLLKLF